MIDEIKNIKSEKSDLRKFGFIIGIFLLILVVFFYLLDNHFNQYLFYSGTVFIIFALFLPVLLLPFHKIWMSIAVVLGFFMTRIILGTLFYLVLTPTGLIAKIFGKKFLNVTIEKEKESYWTFRTDEYEKTNTERQF